MKSDRQPEFTQVYKCSYYLINTLRSYFYDILGRFRDGICYSGGYNSIN